MWNIVGWFLVLLFVPETKNKSLEELDHVFGVPTRIHAAYGLRQIPYFIRRYILRRDVQPEQLYADRKDQAVYQPRPDYRQASESNPEKRV